MEQIVKSSSGSAKLHTRKGFKVSTAVIVAVLLLYAVTVLIPFYMVIVTSFVSDAELQSTIGFVWWPKAGFTLEAYRIMFTEDVYVQNGLLSIPSLFVGFLNTLWTTLLVAFSSLFFSGLAAYSYSKVDFVGKKKFFMVELATMMIPMSCMTVPSYVVYDALGWTYTFLPIIIPGLLGNASMIFFLRSYFDQISKEFVEAAKIDGMGHLGIYVYVMLPIAMPALSRSSSLRSFPLQQFCRAVALFVRRRTRNLHFADYAQRPRRAVQQRGGRMRQYCHRPFADDRSVYLFAAFLYRRDYGRRRQGLMTIKI